MLHSYHPAKILKIWIFLLCTVFVNFFDFRASCTHGSDAYGPQTSICGSICLVACCQREAGARGLTGCSSGYDHKYAARPLVWAHVLSSCSPSHGGGCSLAGSHRSLLPGGRPHWRHGFALGSLWLVDTNLDTNEHCSRNEGMFVCLFFCLIFFCLIFFIYFYLLVWYRVWVCSGLRLGDRPHHWKWHSLALFSIYHTARLNTLFSHIYLLER